MNELFDAFDPFRHLPTVGEKKVNHENSPLKKLVPRVRADAGPLHHQEVSISPER
jgi:hypothetical protein